MAKIQEVGARISDLYFQDYPETSEFFDAADFAFHAGSAYGDLLAQEYRFEYNRMLAEGEMNIVSFSTDWLQVAELKREKDDEGFYIKLPQPIMSFPFDKRNSGIQLIAAASGNKGKEYIRSGINESFYDEFLPITNKVFWSLLRDKIYLTTNVGEPPALSKVVYVPGISDDLDIPDSRVWAVVANTIEMMRKAAANILVKETADQNLNKLPITEADKNIVK